MYFIWVHIAQTNMKTSSSFIVKLHTAGTSIVDLDASSPAILSLRYPGNLDEC